MCVGSEPNLELNLWDFGTSTDDCFLGLTLAVKPSAPNLGKSYYLWHLIVIELLIMAYVGALVLFIYICAKGHEYKPSFSKHN